MLKYFTSVLIVMFYHEVINAQDQTRVSVTDSSLIKTMLYGYKNNSGKTICTAKLIYEYLNNSNVVYETSYYNDTITKKYKGITNTGLHDKTGISCSYNKDGSLKMTINHDKQTWLPAALEDYPNYTLLGKMKLKGDSIIQSLYGKEFFANYVRWNMHTSYYFDKTYDAEPSFSIGWLRDDTKGRFQATEFYVSYNMYFGDRCLENAIRIIIDEHARLLPYHNWNNHWKINNTGLEKINPSDKGSLLSCERAVELARQNGLNEKNLSKIESYLKWEPAKDSADAVFNGHFVLYVLQELEPTPKNEKHNGIRNYNAWLFNPWTKELIIAKELHRENPSFDRIFGE